MDQQKYYKINQSLWPEAKNYFDMGVPVEKLEHIVPFPKTFKPFGKLPSRPWPKEMINLLKKSIPAAVDMAYQMVDLSASVMPGSDTMAGDVTVEYLEETFGDALTQIVFEFGKRAGLLIVESGEFQGPAAMYE